MPTPTKTNAHRLIVFLFAVFSVVMASTKPAWSQLTVDFKPQVVPKRVNTSRNFYSSQRFDLVVIFSVEGGTPEQLANLQAYVKNLGNYSFTSDWPGVDNLLELNTENSPFTPSQTPSVEPRKVGPETNSYDITLSGFMRGGTRGEISLKVPLEKDNVPYSFHLNGQAIQGNLLLRYKSAAAQALPAFRGKAQLGFGGGGPSVEFNGSGVLNRNAATADTITSLSIAAKLPLRRPNDVRDTPGADKDASRDIADVVELSLNRIGYRRGGSSQRVGLKARTTGSLKGLEVVGYYAPLTGWYNQSRGFYALEAEAGYRQGDAEFENLTTRAPDRGHLVARLGSVIEWAPQLGGVNRNLSQGLRFFVRGRGWLDTFKNGDDKMSLRFRPFVDSELFYNFSEEYRVFGRVEYGYLPPDLTGHSSRVYVGVGRSF